MQRLKCRQSTIFSELIQNASSESHVLKSATLLIVVFASTPLQLQHLPSVPEPGFQGHREPKPHLSTAGRFGDFDHSSMMQEQRNCHRQID